MGYKVGAGVVLWNVQNTLLGFPESTALQGRIDSSTLMPLLTTRMIIRNTVTLVDELQMN